MSFEKYRDSSVYDIL